MDNYVDYSGQAGFQDAGEDAGDCSNQHQPQYRQHVATNANLHKADYYNGSIPPSMVCDIKPRLTKSQHEMLESEYTKQNKPSTSTKKGFAEALGVSLDKVNNWFQNRRAKSKQDAKKAAGTFNLFHAQQQANQYSSDSDTSPAFAHGDYFSMMQQCADDHPSAGLGISDAQQYQSHADYQGAIFAQHPGSHAHAQHFGIPQHLPQEMFDSPQELNRRTLTQEQFDAFAYHGNSMGIPGHADVFQTEFSGNQDVLHQVFPELQNGDLKQQNAYAFVDQTPPSLSSNDSTVPSSISGQSINTFPSSSSMRDPGDVSSASSEWADSRSSSVSATYQEDPFSQMHGPPQPLVTSSQWKPGQSVPVDINELSKEFQQAAQARQPPQQYQSLEQPLAWPTDDAFDRRDSQTSSMLAQSMSTVGLQTPQPQQSATFKSPAPPTSIAARRQRPRPAALGIASMRSQSYSGAGQPGSPGQLPPHALTPGQPQIRRIRSSNVVGGVAQGRVQKPMPGAPQRSPLSWTFADAVSSPKALRHGSSGTLAPPTPLSPNEFSRQDQNRSRSGWHASGHVGRQPSISESDFEQGLPYAPAASVPPQHFSSPPHTPMYNQQAFLQQRVGSNVITENTPPQSAPATQSSFPSSSFAVAPQQMQAHAPQGAMAAPAFLPSHQQQYMNVMVPEHQFQAPPMNGMQQHYPGIMQPPSVQGGLPAHYAHGVPVVNSQGQLELIIPPQFAHQAHHPIPLPSQPHQAHTPPKGGQFENMIGMFSTAAPAPAMQVTAQIPKPPPPPPPTEFFVHEYSPPADLKQAATPRKAVDTGPKSYSFANHGPEDFEKRQKGNSLRSAATTSSSPASSNGGTSSS